MSVPPSAMLFDFDGTLADTAADLSHVLNLQRIARGLDPLPLARLRPVVSQGARGLLRIGFDLTPEHDGYESMRAEFLDLYQRNLFRETCLFDGMSAVLDALDAAAIPWGVVTNKHARFTEPLIEALGLHHRAGCVVSGDTCSRAKPHPDPLIEAARRLRVESQRCVYVGDDRRDVEAGRAAGMVTVAALYGYLGEDPNPDSWDAHRAVSHPLELLGLL